MGVNLEDVIGKKQQNILEDKTKKTMNFLMIGIIAIVILIVIVTTWLIMKKIADDNAVYIRNRATELGLIESGVQSYYRAYLQGTYQELRGTPYDKLQKEKIINPNGIKYEHGWYFLTRGEMNDLLKERNIATTATSEKGYYVNYANSLASQNVQSDRFINNFVVYLSGVKYNNRLYYESVDVASINKKKVPDSKIYIKTAEDMKKLINRDNWGKYFVLNADIDMSTLNSEWIPIGDPNNKFTGVFDGKGYAIKNFYINQSNGTNVGLFGNIGKEGIINDLVVIDANVSGGKNVGIIAADCEGRIMNSKVEGKAHAQEEAAGGITGIFSGTIENVTFRGEVTGKESIGGFAGKVNMGSINKVFVKQGSVVNCDEKYTGGLIGQISNSGPVTIDVCYAKAIISCQGDVAGGLVGYIGLNSSSTTTITNCYSNGEIKQCKNDGGGFMGKVDVSSPSTSLVMKYCYSYTPVASNCVSRGGFIGYFEDGSKEFVLNKWIYRNNDVSSDGTVLTGVGNKSLQESKEYVEPLPENYRISELSGWELEKGNWKLDNSNRTSTDKRAVLVGEPED